MKIVLDTNVLISGLLRPTASPGTLLRLVVDGMVPFVVDERILQEYEEVVARPKFGIKKSRAALVLGQFRALGEMVIPRPMIISLPDPDDLVFIEAAVAGRAAAIVTGNKKHFPSSVTKFVAVLNPREALERIAAEK
jgi:putative PIN family toxin of toxin-antitoxin system